MKGRIRNMRELRALRGQGARSMSFVSYVRKVAYSRVAAAQNTSEKRARKNN